MSAHPPVIVRFAPSPTGYLHIGGARTALFNWLYAKHTGGKFLLRIEDTDRARSTESATAALIEGLSWMGLDWDGEPISQFARAERHKEIAYALIEKGAAYKCYATAEELTAFREAHPYDKFISKWRNPDEPPLEGQPYSIRIKAPQPDTKTADGPPLHPDTIMIMRNDGQVTDETTQLDKIEDKVQGTVRVAYSELDDFIILRSDGTPTYLLAVVVDDHDMAITHVIRGDDHLTNTFRQNLIYYGMGWTPPIYAHVPMIHGPDGAKLSKRHGALGVHEYAKLGFLPEALCNYLLRLGWSHGDDEIIPMDRTIELFTLEAINKAPGKLDVKKMEAVNAHYIKEADNARLVDLTMTAAHESGLVRVDEHTARTRLLAGMDDLKQRSKTIVQLAEESAFYLQDNPIGYNETALETLKISSKQLEDINNILSSLHDWTMDSIDVALKELAQNSYAGKLAEIMKPLRGAVCGTMSSPHLAKVLEVLGKDETLARIAQARTL